MRRLVVSEFVMLDGVMEAPGFEEHRDGKNAWALRYQTEEMHGFIRFRDNGSSSTWRPGSPIRTV